jgi:hybrid cluster-associated redox disulfide protein
MSIVADVMDDRPGTVVVFVRNRMHCPGCAMSPFITVGEAAASYRLDVDALIGELRAAEAGAIAEAVR